MALNIKNAEVERLAAEVARLTGETKTEAVRRALEERRLRIRRRTADAPRKERVARFLENEVWARVPDDQKGRMPDRAEREPILGYGSSGV
jgi:antitoxin VapB